MPSNFHIGEFEQLVLLVVLQLGDEAYALSIREELARKAGRRCARGALYRTLDRLERKRFLQWRLEDGTPLRGGHPRRRFAVTPAGVEALKASRATLLRLWNGLEETLQ